MINQLILALRRAACVVRTRHAAAALLACGVLALGACDPRGSASVEELIKRAQDHRAAGNVRASIIELKNALQKEPEHATARLLLGQAFVDLGDISAATIELQRAQELGADRLRANLLLAETKMMRSQFDQVLRELPVNDGDPAEARAAVYGVRGRAHLGLGQRVQAEEAFKAALELDEKSVDALLGLARLSFATGDADKARDLMARAVGIAPEDSKVLSLQAEAAFGDRDFEAAEGFYRQILNFHKDDIAALNAQLGIARAQIAAGKLEDAIARLTQVLKVAPNDPATNYMRAVAAYQKKDYQTAKTHAELALRVARNHRQSVFIAGASNYALGQYEQAFRHLSYFVSEVPDNLQARKLLAATQMRMGQASKAVGTLQSAAGKQGADDAQLLAMIGAASAQSGDLRSASRYLERAVTKQPDDPALRTRLGATQVALGETSDGIEELEKAAELDPQGKADVALILAHLRAKDYDKALEAAKRLQEKQPQNPNSYTLAGLAEIGRNNRAAAKAAFHKALEIKPGDRNAAKNLAALAVVENSFDLARQYYNEVLSRSPGDVQFLILMSQLEARAGRPKEGLAQLEKAVELNPDSARARVTLARVYLLSREPRKASEVLQPALNKNPGEPALLEVMGRAQMALGQHDLAVATFRELVNARQDSSQAHQYLAAAYEQAGNIDRAVSSTETALRLSQDSPAIKFQYARLLARAGKLDVATKMLADLKKTHADEPNLADLEGAVALADNRANDAVEAYQRLLKVQENNFNLLKLARAKVQAGLASEAQTDIQDWLERFPDDVMVRATLAASYLADGQLDKAMTEYNDVLRITPENVLALNNLAWAMTKAGRAPDALPHARKAAQLAPNSPQVMDTLGVTLVAAGKTKEGAETLRNAAAKMPNDPGIQFHLAQALVKDGQTGEARDILRSVLSGNAQWAERAEAESLLKQIGG